ncbi:uncharacterized protein LOC114727346 [Neltuma alba]|uniref:uncharacterized protein LOC114727346 n=1 Tax=Neltuma alba TaxID=207710 RepID=UPI0010A572A4|nr:uncharacterized protein LOC114727346 [Prosopis alba]
MYKKMNRHDSIRGVSACNGYQRGKPRPRKFQVKVVKYCGWQTDAETPTPADRVKKDMGSEFYAGSSVSLPSPPPILVPLPDFLTKAVGDVKNDLPRNLPCSRQERWSLLLLKNWSSSARCRRILIQAKYLEENRNLLLVKLFPRCFMTKKRWNARGKEQLLLTRGEAQEKEACDLFQDKNKWAKREKHMVKMVIATLLAYSERA